MNLVLVLVISAAVGIVGVAGIFFVPEEPYKKQIFVASTLKNMLVGLMVALTLNAESAWWQGVVFGMVYGLLQGLVVFLAKGGPKSKDAPYVLPTSVVTGALTGWLVVIFGYRTA
jgi:hypothetical protein